MRVIDPAGEQDPRAGRRIADARRHRLHGRYPECSAILQEILRRDPMDVEAMLEGAQLAMDTGDVASAERFLEACHHFDPRNADLLVLAAICAFRQRAPDRAVALLGDAVARDPGHLSARVALGQLLRAAGRDEEGDRELQAAFALPAEPGSEAGERRAIARVTTGDWDSGWAEFAMHWESRFASQFRSPRWWRGEPAPAGELHVVAYGGLGDTVLFSRFLPLAAARVGRLHACVPPVTRRLLASVGGIASFMPGVEAIPEGALCTSLWHLPWLVGGVAATRYGTIPCFTAPTDAPSLPAADAYRVGIAWTGNRKMGHDADRSPPSIETLAPLLAVRGVEWIALHPEAEIQAEGRRFGISPMPAVRDLADTAGILAQLDLVITVDTMVANLAPAVGVPTWVFTTTVPEPRWPVGHEQSPWFPGVRAFRRRNLLDWEAAVAAAADALTAVVAGAMDAKSR